MPPPDVNLAGGQPNFEKRSCIEVSPLSLFHTHFPSYLPSLAKSLFSSLVHSLLTIQLSKTSNGRISNVSTDWEERDKTRGRSCSWTGCHLLGGRQGLLPRC